MLNGEVGTDVGGYREVEQVELANSVSSIEHGDCRYTVQRQPRVRHTATDTVSTSPEECRPPPVCYGHPTHTQRRRQICLHERERQPGKQRPLVTVILVNMNVTCAVLRCHGTAASPASVSYAVHIILLLHKLSATVAQCEHYVRQLDRQFVCKISGSVFRLFA